MGHNLGADGIIEYPNLFNPVRLMPLGLLLIQRILMKIKCSSYDCLGLPDGLGVTSAAVAADGAELYKAKACFVPRCGCQDSNHAPLYPKLAGQNAHMR